MLVGMRMTHPIITVSTEMPIVDALNLMKQEHIRRLPVIKDGKLVGIISDLDLMNAAPSSATSLSIWELNYLMSKIRVKDIMKTDVKTVTEYDTIEKAAHIMAEKKIGSLPVMRGEDVVGIITETDLFKVFSEMMGAHAPGVRVTALLPNKHGTLAAIANVISSAGGGFIAFGTLTGESPSNRLAMFKVEGLELAKIRKLLTPLVEKIEDMREGIGD